MINISIKALVFCVSLIFLSACAGPGLPGKPPKTAHAPGCACCATMHAESDRKEGCCKKMKKEEGVKGKCCDKHADKPKTCDPATR